MDWTIEFGWGILLTSFTGSLFFLFWRLAWQEVGQDMMKRAKTFSLLALSAMAR